MCLRRRVEAARRNRTIPRELEASLHPNALLQQNGGHGRGYPVLDPAPVVQVPAQPHDPAPVVQFQYPKHSHELAPVVKVPPPDMRSTWMRWRTTWVWLALVLLALPMLTHLLGYSLIVCVAFLAMSVSADTLTIKVAKASGGRLPIDPICMVIMVEMTKLVASLAFCGWGVWCGEHKKQMLLASQEAARMEAEERDVPEPAQAPSSALDLAKLMAPGAALYQLSNVLNYYGIAGTSSTQYAIFRETGLLWSAGLWCFVFQAKIGPARWVAIVGIVTGCSVKAFQGIHSVQALLHQWGILTVCFQSFCSASAGVANEYALKRSFAVDINAQNAVLYGLGASFALLSLLAFDPGRLRSPAAFFHGFGLECGCIVVLQSLTGICASRILKYADVILKGIFTSLRGPTLMLVSVVMTAGAAAGAPWTANFAWQDLVSAAIICPACMLYLLKK